MKNRKYLLPVVLACSFFSCSKKEKDPTPPLTRTQLLSSKKWQLRSATIEGPGQPIIDIYALTSPCTRDDYEQFNLPNTYVNDEGLTKCGTADPQTKLGLWALINNDTQLTVTYDGQSNTSTIDELTESTLKVTSIQPQGNGTNAIIKGAYVSIN